MVEAPLLARAAQLSAVTAYRDWDYMTGMIASLRLYLHAYGTAPTWNFLLCGGRPELAAPSSWAYTWPSLFAYALPPNYALLALWLVLTLVGFAATRALLLGWVGSPLGASVGACLYAASGYFAAHFNVGHASFAFFHLVPLMMLAAERALEAGAPPPRHLALTALLSFLFFSAGLPHGPMYFYPAFFLGGARAVLGARHTHGTRPALVAAAAVGTAHLLGIWLAAYKLWPVVRWQLDHPRTGVRLEALGLAQLWWDSVTFVAAYPMPTGPTPFPYGVPKQPWHLSWPSWEYNAYVGPAAWLAGALAVAMAARRRAARGGGVVGLGTALVGLGLVLSLGNDHPWSPFFLLRQLPVLEGFRVFARYQILTVFGLAVLAASGVARLQEGGVAPRVAARLLSLAICAPVLVQAGLLVWNVPVLANTEIAGGYRIADRPAPPEFAGAATSRGARFDPHTTLLERGYWVANCYEVLTLPSPLVQVPPGNVAPLSRPPPAEVSVLSHNSVTLRYPAGLTGDVTLDLSTLPTFRYSVPPAAMRHGRAVFHAADLQGRTVTMTATYPGPGEGLWASTAGVLAAAGLALLARRVAAAAARGPAAHDTPGA